MSSVGRTLATDGAGATMFRPMTAAPSPRPRPRKGATPSLKTLPERIADELGGQIANGIIEPGQRLREIEIAASYGVSRAPVREAIRVLARRGLVDFTPRRGAFAVELTVDTLIDTFNVMALLIGLAGRYFALMADEDMLARLATIVTSFEELAEDPDCDPMEFAFAAARVGAFINRNCGSEPVASLLHHQFNNSTWNTVWRNAPLDFLTPQRRRQAAALTRARLEAFRARDGGEADRISREMTYIARDHAVAAFSARRKATFDPRRLVSEAVTPPDA